MAANKNEWNNIVDNNLSHIYHSFEWGELLNIVHGHNIIYLIEKNGVFPIAHVNSKIFGNRIISLPFADYGGPCANNDKDADRLIKRAEDIALDLNVDFIEIRSPNKEYYSLFERNGFIRRDDYFTFILNLNQDISSLWKIVGRKNRNMVRKAKNNSIKIVQMQDKKDLRIFYNIYLKNMKNLGSPPQPYEYFESIWNHFFPNRLLPLLAKYNDLHIAGGLFFKHSNAIHHSYQSSIKDNFNLGQNNLMIWHVIKWGNENNYKSLDFGRTRVSAGNFLFKRKWGGEMIVMPYFYKFIHKELRERDEIKYKYLSELWSKYMPESFSNIIGPHIIGRIG